MDIQKLILEELEAYLVAEDFPPSFNKEVFYGLRSFAERIRYCTQHLPKIAAGSGRIVFKIDDKSVLKLAKNSKGVAQNYQEASIGENNSYFESIVTKVYKSDQHDQWLESELATKLKPTRFRELTGVDIRDLFYYLRNQESQNNGGKQIFSQEQDKVNLLSENEFVGQVVELMLNYQVKAGDLGRLSSYGEVNRNGQPSVVVTDYGLTDEVWTDHYAPKMHRF